MRQGFIYIWFDRKHKMYYIGSHWGPEDDGYICSSTRMRNAYKRRPKDFKRKIIERLFSDRKTLLEHEEIWLKKAEPKRQKYYNSSFHTLKTNYTTKGKSSWNKGLKASDETKRKLRLAHLGQTPWNKNIPHSEEVKLKMREVKLGEKNPRFGTKHSEETKLKISNSVSKNHGMIGKNHSNKTKEKMKLAWVKRKQHG